MAAKKREGFRLDLKEPLAGRFDSYCKANFPNKSELIRRLVKKFLDSEEDQKNKNKKH